jgi:pyruvate/2-oxoglutarate dehydrogenase complex dihydrolipoamide dehydrogenase (E3) component
MDEEQMSSSNDDDMIVLGGGASGESAEYDVIVLGAGPVGEHCAGHLAAGALKVAVVERELIGGERSYYACIPSKTPLPPGEALAGALAAPAPVGRSPARSTCRDPRRCANRDHQRHDPGRSRPSRRSSTTRSRS